MTDYRELIYESIIQSMSEGIMTIDLKGMVDSYNPAAERILNKKKEDVIGHSFAGVFISDLENDDFNQSILDAMYDRTSVHKKIVPWHSGGQARQLYMVTSFLFREEIKIGTIIVFSDITELAELKVRYAQDMEELLGSLVNALSAAIDERSHYNANHTQNMVKMAGAFLDWMRDNGNPWNYDEVRRRAFIMSVGLHDVGKLTVPLEIMDKATRLGSGMDRVRDRFARVKLLNRIAMLEGRITKAEFSRAQAEADEDLAFINRVNAVNMMTDEDFQGVRNLASKTFTDENGQTQSLLTDREITMLSVRKGTLTAEERVIMQGHVASTSHILKEVRFPQMFADVPVWASCHHELLNSKGYPKGLSGSEIPKEVRLLTILDIFEAFTAKDRPYKPAHSVENAWEILDGMVREGAVDGEILEDFKKSRAWACVAAEE